MPSYTAHISQVNKNLSFLASINHFNSNWDWQVTVCFYSALHMVNAHLDKSIKKHYKSHQQTESVLNPYNKLSPAKLDEEIYTAYISLKNLSKRSRYLCHEDNGDSERDYPTYEKHLSKAIKKLDLLLSHFNKKYNINHPPYSIKCTFLKPSDNLNCFTVN